MKNLDCNQIKIFINLAIIGEEDKNKTNLYVFFLNLKKKNTFFIFYFFMCSYIIF